MKNELQKEFRTIEKRAVQGVFTLSGDTGQLSRPRLLVTIRAGFLRVFGDKP